jgi:SnoaL-like domain
MVWIWPSRYDAHDPVDWRFGMGRFDGRRWRRRYEQLFSEWELVHNRREIVKIEISEEQDAGFAVLDIDTLWRRRSGMDEMRWQGRVCKVYSLVGGAWKMTMHTGALTYPVQLEPTASQRRDVAHAAKRWAEVWAGAWPAADVEAIAALYAPEAVFHSHPFRERQTPREYVERVFTAQAEAECRFGEPLVAGERAAVDWWGVIRDRDGSVETVAGTSLLRFDESGLVVAQRDAWASVPERHELSAWAPPRAHRASAGRVTSS